MIYGKVWKQSGLRVNYFSQQFDLIENNTVEQELTKILSDENEQYKIDIFCDNLALDKKNHISNLSGGQKRRVGLIKTLILESDIFF